MPISTRLPSDLLERVDAISQVVTGAGTRTDMIVQGLELVAQRLEAEPYTVQIPGVGVWHKRAGERFLNLDQIRVHLKR